jgi:hypothetical protein
MSDGWVVQPDDSDSEKASDGRPGRDGPGRINGDEERSGHRSSAAPIPGATDRIRETPVSTGLDKTRTGIEQMPDGDE